jgi:hypothetical protein
MTKEFEHPSVLAAKRRVEPQIIWDHTPRLEPGQYRAYCRSAKIYRDPQFKRWVCAVQFDVLSEDLTQKLARLTWFLNLGNGEEPRVTRRKNYWKAWIAANGAQPKRRDRTSPRIFVKRYAVVVVADTTKDFRQQNVSEEHAYSVIREVVRWETGCPQNARNGL